MLIECKECGADISGQAIICPKCGYTRREPEEVVVILKNPIATGVLLGCGFLISLLIIAAAGILAAAIIA